ncbi:Tether containing UBX domain for GLUT4 [Cladochytrium tenue]|nr:Tether containing UBX domain for GLUT4 [Cladochytrium tenue]
MASSVTVELDGEPSRRVVIKTTPGMPVKAIVTLACERLKLAPSDLYGLRYQKSVLDLSLSVRFANLPAGAKLLLIRQRGAAGAGSAGGTMAAAEVTIAVQVDDGTRLVHRFPAATTTLWGVLRHFERADTARGTVLTRRLGAPAGKPSPFKRAQPPVHMVPVLVLMNREFGSIEALASTTLMDAGLQSGNAMLRLLFRLTDRTLEEALPAIEAADAAADAIAGPSAAPASAPTTAATPVPGVQGPAAGAALPPAPPGPPEAAKVVESTQSDTSTSNAAPLDTQEPTASSSEVTQDLMQGVEAEAESTPSLDRGLKFFLPPPDAVPVKIELPDSFFELTSAELKALMQHQKARSKFSPDAPLMTRAMREREEDLRRPKYPKTLIRVRFPDRTTLQATFLSHETVAAVYEIVQTHLSPTAAADDFVLYTPPARLLSDRAATLAAAGLAPATMLLFRPSAATAGPTFLAPHLRMEEFPAPPSEDAAGVGGGSDGAIPGLEPEMEDIAATSARQRGGAVPTATDVGPEDPARPRERKMPKWFKTGK